MRRHEFVHRCNEHIRTGNEHVCLSIVKKYILQFLLAVSNVSICVVTVDVMAQKNLLAEILNNKQ